MPPSSRNKKKKSKSKNQQKKAHDHHHTTSTQNTDTLCSTLPSNIETEIYDQNEEYPTSRVIKRAPNGDVVVQSLHQNDNNIDTDPHHYQHQHQHQHQLQLHNTNNNNKKSKKKSKNNNNNNNSNEDTSSKNKNNKSSMAFTLDSHWESLSPNEKKSILRIEKNEVFNVIKRYQNDHSCSCTVCGRRHLAMDQEMERIYNILYDIDKIKDPEINPIKFHLGIIKELQISKKQQQQQQLQSQQPSPHENEIHNQSIEHHEQPTHNEDSLQDEVRHFKNFKKHQLQLLQEQQQHQQQQLDESDNHEEQLRTKYLEFTKAFVTSHPKIAQDYVEKLLQYPTMKAITDDLIKNTDISTTNGKNFVTALQNFVMENTTTTSSSSDPTTSSSDSSSSSSNSMIQDPREFTTMLHNGTPLTSKEYFDLQRNIAERMTSSYDSKRHKFNEVSPLEKELFTRFMFGNDRKEFGELVMNSFRNKFDKEFGGTSISASLAAAAAAATASITQSHSHSHSQTMQQQQDEEYMYYDDDDDDGESNDEESDLISEYEEDQSEYYEEQEEEDEEEEYERDEESYALHECNDRNHQHQHQHFSDEEELERALEQHMLSHDDHTHDHAYDHVQDEEHVEAEIHGHHMHRHHMHHQHQHQHRHGLIEHDEPIDHGHEDEIEDEIEDEVEDEDEDEDEGEDEHEHEHENEEEDEDEDEDEEEEEYDSGIDEEDRLEEGRKLIQIAITKLLQGRIMASYHEKQAENNRLKLLKELEDEKLKQKEKEEKKQKKREKEKEKKRQLQLAKEEERRKKILELEGQKRENERKEQERRELQRKKVEEAKRKKDEEKKRKLQEQRRREEQQEQQRRLKEEQRQKKEVEKKEKEEQKRLKEELQEKARKDEIERQRRLKQVEEANKKEKERQQKLKEKASQQQAKSKSSKSNALPPTAFTGPIVLSQTSPQNVSSSSSTKDVNTTIQASNFRIANNTSISTGYQSVSDDILQIVNAATASNSKSVSPSHLNDLVNPLHNNKLSTETLKKQDSDFETLKPQLPTNGMFAPNISSQQGQMSFDNIYSMHPMPSQMQQQQQQQPFQMHQMSGPLGLIPQSYALPNWNSVMNHPQQQQQQQQSILNAMQTSGNDMSAQTYLQPQSHSQSQQHNPTTFPPVGENHRKSFADELQSLTNILSSAGIDDPNFVPTASASTSSGFKQTSLWNTTATPNTASTQLEINHPLTPASTSSNLTDVNTLPSMQNMNSSLSHRSSIWGSATPAMNNSLNTHSSGIATTNILLDSVSSSHGLGIMPPSIRNDIHVDTPSQLAGIPQNSESPSFLTSNIWNSSFPNSGISKSTTAPGAGVTTSSLLDPQAYSTVRSNNGSNLFENIYNNYLMIAGRDLTTQYVSIDILYQNLLGEGLDYPSLIKALWDMRITYNADLLPNNTGLATHVKMLGPQQRMARQSSSLLNSIGFNLGTNSATGGNIDPFNQGPLMMDLNANNTISSSNTTSTSSQSANGIPSNV
ncbi:Nst1p NDAI_0F02570 [Naumovozyma dairenensis CBS 421]|uniref:Stress response protein NST1 n=1 Tax=Naumovozyma dairenensis (strain ATCC 10597 / BCRC 20456 / CBS 421 / NBRC 0211 / NRRL Y-12639) TaxID=1071378 RepID=G0WCR4_NAUDC|nr:hypothetical protein NDAI_0F02570 [Naumovozyma dairenensis CBS 421]CCD25575.1 hypothetical protein NDAI_0F02570 [Naumovozyma dairenensis CBS 421]